MYFSSIDITNYGSISKFYYNFRFDKEGHPIPLVLIGENGTGKTLVLANMVDSLIEIKRNTYGNAIFEVNEKNYFKIGSKNYITIGQNTSRVVITLNHKSDLFKYTDIMSNDPELIAKDEFVKQDDIDNSSSFEENGFFRKTVGKLKKKSFSDFITLYFPADRFYIPLWYNSENYTRIDYSRKTNISHSDTNIIKIDVLSNIKDWLTYVYLQTTLHVMQMPDGNNIPEELRGKQVSFSIDTGIQSIIRKVMNTILGTNDYSPKTTDRRRQMVSITMPGINCKDITQLSEGQISLFAITLSIIKEWDETHDNFDLSDISGCVIIDEADLGLHVNYMYECFPRMMQLFPNVQFVLTTHSPFLVAGLSKIFGENIDVLAMPEGVLVSDINTFSEVQEAQKIIFEQIDQIRAEDKKLKDQVERLRNLQVKTVLFTEGTTDEILLKKALEKLNLDNSLIEICAASQNHGKHNDDAIKKLLVTLQENPCSNNTIIGMFDRDANPPVELTNDKGEKVKLVDHKYVKLGEHLFAFAIPIPHNREEGNQISIEHYFTDEEIKTENENQQRLFLGNEFYPSGNCIDDSKNYHYRNARNYCNTIRIIEHEQNAFVTDKKGDNDFSLSKKRFAEAVYNDMPGFSNFDFSEFNKIFDIIREITTDEQMVYDGS
ncbi:MAG: AAA family ATPase [Lachnospiraceae bacterium]|nr:AAA family ATPase [Lachnospiraceae bacterium]